MRVDAHHHLWDTEKRDCPWMDGPWADPIRGRFDVDTLTSLARGHGFDATIVVQAVTDVAETRELLDVCGASATVRGVVGWVDLTAPDVADVLAALRDGPGGRHLVGVRHPAQDESDDQWLLRPDTRRGIAAVGRAGLAYDLLVRPPQLAAAVRTVHEHPDVAFVLDHLGKPAVAEGAAPTEGAWAGHIAALAAAPNVSAKLSGLVTEDDWASWASGRLIPFAHHALELFGPQRLMFGSDWPVCTLAATYGEVVDLATEAVSGLSESERAEVFGGTAERWYGLDSRLD